MPEGLTHSFTTDGSNRSKSLQAWLGVSGTGPPVRRSWSIRIRLDPQASANVNVGRFTAIEKVVPGDSVSFDFARFESLYLSDLGVSGLTVYVDDSGPLDPGDIP